MLVLSHIQVQVVTRRLGLREELPDLPPQQRFDAVYAACGRHGLRASPTTGQVCCLTVQGPLPDDPKVFVTLNLLFYETGGEQYTCITVTRKGDWVSEMALKRFRGLCGL